MLFIPLSIDGGSESESDLTSPGKLQVANEIVEQGIYIEVFGEVELKGRMDFLLVRLD